MPADSPEPLIRTEAPAVTAQLRILATTDVHSHVLAYDYYADRESADVGLARTATLIAAARAEVPDALLFDNGDFLQGNPMGDLVMQAALATPHRPHPAIAAMNRLAYDAATLGNHEFNFGLERLLTALADARFPVVAANLRHRTGEPVVPAWCLLERALTGSDGRPHPIRIGVIGFVPPQIVQWDRAHLEGVVETHDIVQCARVLVPLLRAAGADLVVALSHSGLGPADAGAHAEHASTDLARVPGIDAIVAGHSHLPFPGAGYAGQPGMDPARGLVFGVPVVLPGFYGSHLGVIDLDLARDRQGGWHLRDSRAHLRGIAGVNPPPDPAIAATVGADHAATLAHIRRPVGHSHQPLHSYFATVAPCAALDVVARAQAEHVRHQLRGRPEAALPLLSAVSPFKAGGRGGPGNYTDIPAGPLALRNIADLYIFPNTIAALRLTGAEIADWLENSAGLWQQVTPGARDAALIDADFPSYNHDRILGLDYRIDLSQPPRYDRHGALLHAGAQRIRDLRFQGQPVRPEQEFILATNSYRAAGCGGYASARPERMVEVGRDAIRDILLRHLAGRADSPVPPAPAPCFVPMPGTSVIYETGPAATAHLADIAALRPEPLGPGAEGFARFRLHL